MSLLEDAGGNLPFSCLPPLDSWLERAWGLHNAFKGITLQCAVQTHLSQLQLVLTLHLCSTSTQFLGQSYRLPGDLSVHMHAWLMWGKHWICEGLVTGFHSFPLTHRGGHKQATTIPHCQPRDFWLKERDDEKLCCYCRAPMHTKRRLHQRWGSWAALHTPQSGAEPGPSTEMEK